jgi:ABC-2 type transport system permease protein
MTTTAYAPVAPARRHAVRSPSLLRLTAVELRKMADTRAGIWLLAIVALLSAALVTIVLIWGEPAEMTLSGLFLPTLLPMSVLLPVLGILSVTSEWGQRTTLTTFALVPRRLRIAAAKLLACVALAVASVAVSLAFSAVGNVIGAAVADGDGSWRITATTLGHAVLYQVIGMVMGIAFGMLLMNSALSIVLFFLLPTAWAVLGTMIGALQKPAEWLELGQTMDPLVSGGMTGAGWARLATSVAVWVLVPLAAGLVRLHRREVS